MKSIKMWTLQKTIALCNLALEFKEGAADQEDTNEMVSIKNSCIQRLNKLQRGK